MTILPFFLPPTGPVEQHPLAVDPAPSAGAWRRHNGAESAPSGLEPPIFKTGTAKSPYARWDFGRYSELSLTGERGARVERRQDPRAPGIAGWPRRGLAPLRRHKHQLVTAVTAADERIVVLHQESAETRPILHCERGVVARVLPYFDRARLRRRIDLVLRPRNPSSVRSISVSFGERWRSSGLASKRIGSSPSPSQALASAT